MSVDQRCPKSVLSIGFVLNFLHTNIYEKLNTNPILNTDLDTSAVDVLLIENINFPPK